MQEAGLFRVKSKDVIDWQKLKKEFSLITEEVNIANPTNISYVYGGYAPLSIRFIEILFEKEGFKNMASWLKLVPGPQKYPENEREFFESL